MDTEKMKLEIIRTLQSTSDENLIDEVYALLNPDESIKEIQMENMPVDLQNKITRALDDYKNGRYITQEQMKQKVAQWLTN